MSLRGSQRPYRRGGEFFLLHRRDSAWMRRPLVSGEAATASGQGIADRLFGYSQALERGILERSNRPNYRAVLEYDGVLSRRVSNKESARAKTREELLAEERDYKRRRTSYRGKKVNRNPTEILRDIIDEHMDEIKQAGGIGYVVEAPADIAWNVFKSNSHSDAYHGSYDFASSYSHDEEALASRSSSCDNPHRADSLGRFSSRSSDTRFIQ